MNTNAGLITATPGPGRYTIDQAGTTISFRTRHLFGLAPVTGTFAIRSGEVTVGELAGRVAVAADIDAASFSTGNPVRDRTVRSRRYLDTATFPLISVRSDDEAPAGGTIAGQLTVRGVSRPVTLTVTSLTAEGTSFTVTATTRIDRTEFGLTAARGVAGRYLSLTVRARFVGSDRP